MMTETIFQLDNTPANTAKVTKKWLVDNSFELIYWPGQI